VLVFFPHGNRPDLGQALDADELALNPAAAAGAAAGEAPIAGFEAEELANHELEAEQQEAQEPSFRMAALARYQEDQQFRDGLHHHLEELQDMTYEEEQTTSMELDLPAPAEAPAQLAAAQLAAPALAQLAAPALAQLAAAAEAQVSGQAKKARKLAAFSNYASVFVVRAGSGREPNGVQQVCVNGSTFPAVSGYHSLTLVNHNKPELSITLSHSAEHPNGRLRIRCSDEDPDYNNVMTRWGSRKFIKVSV
jgi:hypothetical protein